MLPKEIEKFPHFVISMDLANKDTDSSTSTVFKIHKDGRIEIVKITKSN